MVLPSVVNFTHLSAAYLFFHRSCQPLSCHFLAVSESKIIHKCSLLAFSFSDPFTNQNRKSLTVCNPKSLEIDGLQSKVAWGWRSATQNSWSFYSLQPKSEEFDSLQHLPTDGGWCPCQVRMLRSVNFSCQRICWHFFFSCARMESNSSISIGVMTCNPFALIDDIRISSSNCRLRLAGARLFQYPNATSTVILINNHCKSHVIFTSAM